MRLSNSQRAFLLQATETYKASIHLGKDYLASRGLSVEEVQRFHLGVVEHPLPGHEGYTGRLAIPYVTPSGVVDIRFRTMSGGDPKYMGMPGAKTTMFNSQAVLTADGYICVTEGEIDCITVVAKTNHPSVGIPGANNWKPYYSKILDDFETVIFEYKLLLEGMFSSPGTTSAGQLAGQEYGFLNAMINSTIENTILLNSIIW